MWSGVQGACAVFIKSNLFNRGGPMMGELGLSAVLEGHKQGILNKIKAGEGSGV